MCTNLLHYFYRITLALSTELNKLQEFNGILYPQHDEIMKEYFKYEALSKHDYNFTCLECGLYPAIVVTDVDKSCSFRLNSKCEQGTVLNINLVSKALHEVLTNNDV